MTSTIAKDRPLRLDEIARTRTSKADAERDRAEFLETAARAEAKGNRAMELLRTLPAGKYGDAKAEDYAAPVNPF